MSIDIVTFGCRLNASESEAMPRDAEAAGLGDTVVVNTCAVTAEAVRQARQAIRRLARERPEARIVVTGCAAQIEPRAFAAMPEVDRVLGNEEKMQRRDLGRPRLRDRARPQQCRVNDIMAVQGDGAASHRRHGGPGPRLRPGAERLRPPLHVLHHPLWPRQFALGADGRGRRAGPQARRERLRARSC